MRCVSMKGVLLAAILAGTVQAAGAVTTLAVPSCAAWATPAIKPGAQQWLLGYLTGANDVWLALNPSPKPVEPLDKAPRLEDLMAFMDAFCRANPQENVFTGAQKVFLELEKRAQPTPPQGQQPPQR